MAIRFGINGFGRMGRLGARAGWNMPELEIVRINENATGANGAAHLLKFDIIHGAWEQETASEEGNIIIDGKSLAYTSNNPAIDDSDWSDCDIVIEATG
jgi:glyceraldehyde 3-phosphate dehydrogenase